MRSIETCFQPQNKTKCLTELSSRAARAGTSEALRNSRGTRSRGFTYLCDGDAKTGSFKHQLLTPVGGLADVMFKSPQVLKDLFGSNSVRDHFAWPADAALRCGSRHRFSPIVIDAGPAVALRTTLVKRSDA